MTLFRKIYAPVVLADHAWNWFSPLFLLGLRVYEANVFVKSGLSKIQDFSSTVAGACLEGLRQCSGSDGARDPALRKR